VANATTDFPLVNAHAVFFGGGLLVIFCHLGLPNKCQHPKDQHNPFDVLTFISAIYPLVSNCNLNNPQTTAQLARPRANLITLFTP
jgi:hypothetical protein